jgi:ER lumen protein retaining receptor
VNSAGDMTHLASILVRLYLIDARWLAVFWLTLTDSRVIFVLFQVLLLKIQATKSCSGVSMRTQELYAIVFVSRYLDLFFSFISLYNTVMKMIFISSSCCVLWYMRVHRVVSQTYDREQDTFRIVFLLLPSFMMALVINHEFSFVEVLWTFSIYLEAVAILPQLVLLQRTKNIDTLTGNYVFLLGGYRALYLLNWIYRYLTEPGYSQWIVWFSGLIQTALYCDFFYYYLQSWRKNERLSLPS